MRPITCSIPAAAAVAVLWLASPAEAQGERVPPNPFASNFPSEPPPPVVAERRDPRIVRTRRVRRPPPPPEIAPLPSGLVPD
ncbi:hypothetical protein [Methylobacterium dankookense]|uniref:Uncharacterized protein n=1 Tax=Methylobacterium dankookense TaxID=560405 RepID=A0A564FVL5_9HYPH|nr:hypothetical protein [Methylobacterium dankookense]GJD57541.1 hypothetical protein IFDJLNFL_3444 [Methylobacterium dankookense]VUF11461.1 hypothetical protein MTDSW087_01143 [Methylobacterium dankookense]